jgi:hypothetical protein
VRIQGPRGEAERRFALVRSVAVTAPIESLAADERHRLGVLFLIDPEADLALYTSEVEQAAERRERQRLAGLLSHGVETLARVLEHSLCSAPGPDAMSRFVPQLAEYLERRLQVTAWLLDHWDAAPPLARASVVDAAQARAPIDRLSPTPCATAAPARRHAAASAQIACGARSRSKCGTTWDQLHCRPASRTAACGFSTPWHGYSSGATSCSCARTASSSPGGACRRAFVPHRGTLTEKNSAN